ncbi:molybdate ABC transporter substrate-binding protein [Paenibacillus sp. LHD-38]|uniref:molybdate ABC transporter substrate-binding protein n=1 Tax=Paenibacillus sp. LHD-38 TaxID=3072143 RepID=UPI00280CFEC9|nr:molybdate ABC transporter substrate-binding protein [Paenibacillus sp. LHD-38]MDQ8739227.1 molybdate ABC transporter substrate-binding protein [Paenibacillus sp. LHD-38]
MLRMIKGYMILSTVLAMMLVFAGCGAAQNTNTNAGTAAPAESTIEPSEQPAETVELTISAAASMTDALTEIHKTYEAKNQNIKLNFNFGASGALQQQIEQGAPADLFLSAAVKNMTALVD